MQLVFIIKKYLVQITKNSYTQKKDSFKIKNVAI